MEEENGTHASGSDKIEKKEEAVEELQEAPQLEVQELLASIPGSPSKEQIDTWKAQTDVQASIFSETDVFLWRPVNWQEYKMLQQAAAENAQNPNFFDEQLIYKCVLWPAVQPANLPGLKGGTIPTLSQQIMEGSNFIPPQIAMNLVVKL